MEGGAGALGTDEEGGTGAGDAGAVEGGTGGFTMGGIVAAGGAGNEGAAGITGAGEGGATTPGADGGFGIPGADGGLGIPGTDGGFGIPGADGGLGIAGIEDGGRGTAGIPGIDVGGFSPTGAVGGGGETAEDPPDTGMGFGGRLIIAVSRGLEAMGDPSRRAGRTILTVSFLGSAIVCSEWVKGRLCCSSHRYSQIPSRVSITPRKIVAQNYLEMSSFQRTGCAAMKSSIIWMHSWS